MIRFWPGRLCSATVANCGRSPAGRDHGEHAEQDRLGASDRRIGALPLALDAEVATDLGEGGFDRPAADEPAWDVEQANIELARRVIAPATANRITP